MNCAPHNGRCIIVSAPSGAGKTTIVKHLLKAGLGLEFSVSACSRPMRPGEVHGRDYYFINIVDFQNLISKDEFIEWQEVYPGSYYGTLRSEIERIWNDGHHVIFDVDVYGGINLKKIFGEMALSLFIMPPSVEVLEQRLRARSTDSEESLQARLSKAKLEMEQHILFDKFIINDNLDQALQESILLVTHFLQQSTSSP
ncbi:MAG: guanylate kinase [Bacteroidetes bacterium]|nr:guanylate kinase [Bacteroidota bacterium]